MLIFDVANPLYLLVGNRTWLVCTALASIQLILIFLFIIFFKRFKAKKEVTQNFYILVINFMLMNRLMVH